MTPITRFRDLPPLGRAVIVVVVVLTFGIAAVAGITSYDAIYDWITGQQLYSDKVNHIYPLLLETAFIVAQFAAILAGIMRAILGGDREVHRGWPITVMLLSGGLAVWFNVLHADAGGNSMSRRIAAALPPLLTIFCFEICVSIVRWVMKSLGRPLDAGGALSPAAGWPAYGQLGGPVPGQLYRPDGYPGGYAPAWAPPAANPQAPTGQDGQNGQAASKRQAVEAYLATLTPDQLAAATRGSVTARLRDAGVQVSEQHVSQVLGEWRAQLGSRRRRARR